MLKMLRPHVVRLVITSAVVGLLTAVPATAADAMTFCVTVGSERICIDHA